MGGMEGICVLFYYEQTAACMCVREALDAAGINYVLIHVGKGTRREYDADSEAWKPPVIESRGMYYEGMWEITTLFLTGIPDEIREKYFPVVSADK